VVGHHFHRLDEYAVLLCYGEQNMFQSLLHVANKNFAAVLRAPDDLIRQVKDCCCAFNVAAVFKLPYFHVLSMTDDRKLLIVREETALALSPEQFAEKVAISFSSTSKTSMRGHDKHQESMFSYISPEKRVPPGHPLRRVREMVDVALQEMSAEFAQLYSRSGRPSIAPEKLLRALLLQCFYSVRS